MLTLPIMMILIFTAPDILMIFNPSYREGVPVFQVLAFSQFTFAIVGPAALMLIMTHYMRLNLLDLFITLILSLILDFFLIPLYGALGAAVAGAIALVFINSLRLIQVYLLLGIHPFSKGYIKSILAACVAGLVTYGGILLLPDVLQPVWRFFAISLLFGGIYILMIKVLGEDDADSETFRTLIKDLMRLS
jgi:O-antigen/teichoic acid export membrane protein